MFPKWRPISTAPKDGTKILIFEADEGVTGIVRVSRWRDDTIPTGWTGSERAPSHWLPLPLPPKEANPRLEQNCESRNGDLKQLRHLEAGAGQ